MNQEDVLDTVNIPEKLENQLKDAIDEEKLTEKVYVDALKDSYQDYKEEISFVAQRFRDNQDVKVKDALKGVNHDSKTDLAHAYADIQINHKNTKPVVIDSTTLFFRYKSESRTWEQIDLDMLHKELDQDLTKDPINETVTQHLHNEFSSKMKNHYNYVDWENFGLNPEQVLMKNGKILELENYDEENPMHKVTREAQKQDYAINAVNAIYDPDADIKYEDTRLEEFIRDTIPNDEELEALQQFLGFCLMWPSDKYEKSLLLLGPTDSGKSTLLKVIKHFFKESNTTEISFPQLGQERAFHVDELKQSVINFDHDMAEKALKQRARVKKIISKEEIYADPKMEKGYTMKPVSNFIIASNHPPDHDGADDAFLKRFLTIEAPTTVSEEDKERDLLEKLTTEKAMNWLFHWAVDGYESLMTMNRFAVNRGPKETKELWSKYGGTVSRFVNEQVSRGTDDARNIPTRQLFETYKVWCEEEYEEPESFQVFVSKAADHPIMTKKKAFSFEESAERRMCFVDIEVKMSLEESF